MEAWNSFLQTVFQFVKSLFANVSKKMHRNAAVLTTGVAVVTVIAFTAGDFHGGGRNALVAFADTPGASSPAEAELEETQAAAEPDMDELPVQTDVQETAEHESETTEAENEDETIADGETAPEEAKEAEDQETEEGTESSQESDGASKDEIKAAGLSGERKMTDGIRSAKGTRAPGDAGDQDGGDEAGEASNGTGLEQVEDDGSEASVQVTACSADDYEVLLRIVQAEAGGCDLKGRILVANVILNRVKSDEFPDTIRGVVYEKSQFSPVSNGSINTCKVSEKTVEAVDRALAGEDYSQGALYFMNRRASSGKNVRWFDSHLDYLFQHGNHEFFK